jgi:MFS family permease
MSGVCIPSLLVLRTSTKTALFFLYLHLLRIVRCKIEPTRLTLPQVFQAGAAINVFIAAYVADRWGRKAAIYECGLLSLFGGAMLVGARNSTMFIIARLFAGGGSWGYLAVTPFYSAELAPP